MLTLSFIRKFFILAALAAITQPVFLPAQNTSLLNQKFAIAQLLEKQGEMEKALELYRELYAVQPGNNRYYTKLRRTLENLKRLLP